MRYTDPNELITRFARILIVDYDVLRYHSFDMFRWLIRDPNYFIRIHDEEFRKSFVSVGRNVMDQVDMFLSTCPSVSPFELFDHVPETNQERLMRFLDRMLVSKTAKTTHTDLSVQFCSILNTAGISLFVRRHTNDNTSHLMLSAPSRRPIQIDRSDRLLDTNEIVSYIQENRINMLICSSIELATSVGVQLIAHGYKDPMSIMFGRYRYNYFDLECSKDFKSNRPTVPILRTIHICNELESQYQYEFGVFDPFTGISDVKYITRRQNDDQHSI